MIFFVNCVFLIAAGRDFSQSLFSTGIVFLHGDFFFLHGDFFVIPTVCHGHPVQVFHTNRSLKQAWTRFCYEILCGETGIRTPETLLEFTRFPGVPLQPLEHLSFSPKIKIFGTPTRGGFSKSATKLQHFYDIRK